MTVNSTVDEMYPSKWLKPDEVPDGDLILTVADVTFEGVGPEKEMKLVLAFRENTKRLVCNVTNAKTLKGLYGKDPNEWIGKRIALYATEVPFGGEQRMGIRVRMRPPAQEPAAAPVAQPAMDNIPY